MKASHPKVMSNLGHTPKACRWRIQGKILPILGKAFLPMDKNNKTMTTVLFSFWKYKSREFCMIQKHLMKGTDYILVMSLKSQLKLCTLSIIKGKLNFLTQKQTWKQAVTHFCHCSIPET